MVADVAAVSLGLAVKRVQRRVFLDVQEERVVRSGRCIGVPAVLGPCLLAPFDGVLFAVEGQVSHREDKRGNAVDPPVDEIEVVGRFVDEKSTRKLLLAVPAPEIVRAVRGIEEIFEINVLDPADFPGLDQLAHLTHAGRPAVVEGGADITPRFLDRLENGAAFLRVPS